MRKPFVAGNWKMNGSVQETESLINGIKQRLEGVKRVDIAICPPFPYLALAVDSVKGSQIQVGAQNVYFKNQGAFTGEVAPVMLKDIGCQLVILGHSERRQFFGESDEIVNLKLKLVLKSGLSSIVCVGETLEQREAEKTSEVVEKQIRGSLEGLTLEEMTQVTIAYEPIWAIGTGKTATPTQAQAVHQLIRGWLTDLFGIDLANAVRIQYGGSVKPENATELMAQPDIDGALVGGASLNAESFSVIIKAAQ